MMKEVARVDGRSSRTIRGIGWVLQQLAKLGWVWSLGQPRPESAREDLIFVDDADKAVARSALTQSSS